MLIKEEGYRINFIDSNDCFVGFDYSADCCESFGYFVSETLGVEQAVDSDLSGYIFDVNTRPIEVETEDSYECGGVVAFRCVNRDGSVLWLHLYNSHNGYYGHGWDTSWGCEGYL